MSKNKIISILIVAFYFLCFFPINFSYAQNTIDTIGIKVSPVVKEINTQPGSIYKDKIIITNLSNEDISIDIEVKDFTALGEKGDTEFIDPQTDNLYSMAGWFELPKNIKLGKNEQTQLPYTINIPPKATAGGHYGAIILSPSKKISSVVNISTIAQVGVMFLVDILGTSVNIGEIVSFNPSQKIYFAQNDISLITRISNKGNTHFSPEGEIIITNLFGKEIANYTFNEKNNNILPNSIRKFKNEIHGNYFGIYKAKANILISQGKYLTSQTTFVILSWKETLLVLLIVVLVILLTNNIRKRNKSKASSK